jgi:GTP-binding protein
MVDMPGYGYAAVAKSKIEAWNKLMRSYLRGRSSLKRVYVLVDGRHGIKDVDQEMFKLLDTCAVSYQIILTKLDEVKKSEREQRVAQVLADLAKHPAAYPQVIFTSSETGEGIAELRAGIVEMLAQMGL